MSYPLPLQLSVIASALAATLLAGCGGTPAERAHRENVRLATSPDAMWYRFRFAANYRGVPFTFDQFVHCGTRTIPGGPFDSTPAVVTRSMYPRTIGQRMRDGSYIVLRVPDLCHRHRARDASGSILVGWASRGPFSVLPLVTWNDRRPDTSVIEQYVGQGYYRQAQARVTNPRGSAVLMPVGFHPANALAVLDQREWATSDPDENIDPSTGRRWPNSYATNNNGLTAFYTVPTADMAAAMRRFRDPPERVSRELNIAKLDQTDEAGAVDQVRMWLNKGREEISGFVAQGGKPTGEAALLPVPGEEGARVRVYQDWVGNDPSPFEYDPAYLPPQMIWGVSPHFGQAARSCRTCRSSPEKGTGSMRPG